MPGQLSYPLQPEEGLSGDVADNCEVDSITLTTLTDTIAPGRAVARVTGDEEACKLPVASTDVLRGIARRELPHESGLFLPNDPLAVAREGRFFVEVDQDVSSDDPVYVRFRVDPHVITLTFSGNLITGNHVNGTINGEAIADVPFNTSDAITAQDVANAIAALSDIVASAIVSATDVITVTSQGNTTLTSSFLVTGGVSQATVAQATVSGPSTGDQLGIFRMDDDDTGVGAAAIHWTRAEWLKGGSANKVAIVAIDLP